MLYVVTQTTEPAAAGTAPESERTPRIHLWPSHKMSPHRAWFVAAVTFVTIIGAAAFRSLPGLLIDPLNQDFGWSRGTIGAAVSVNLALYGLTAPFAAALMDRFGIRKVVAVALTVIALGSGLTVWMTAAWQLMLCWGLLVGLGSGSMALAFAATVTNRWFTERRGLVTGILTAASASGQLIFLPLLSWIVEKHGWRPAAVTVALAALAVVPFVWLLLRDHPADVGVKPYGATEFVPKPAPAVGAARRAVTVLSSASRTGTFWLLAGTFAICGASTNGLIQTHFVPAAHDHGMPITAAASLLAVIGVFDVVGTIASGWFTDRFEPRRLLAVYYALRGISSSSCPCCWPRASTRRCCSSSSSTASTGSPPSRPPSPCAASSTATTARSSSAGSSPPTRSAPHSWPSSAASPATPSARTTWSGTCPARCARWRH